MGNCLVTKLKGSVDAFLPKLGQYSVNILKDTETSNHARVLVRTTGGSINLEFEANPSNGITFERESNNLYKFVHSDDYEGTVHFGNYYNDVYEVGVVGASSSDLLNAQSVCHASIDITRLTKYAKMLGLLNISTYSEVTGKLYPNESLITVAIGSVISKQVRDVECNIDEWTNTTKLTLFSIKNNTKATGNIVSLAKNIGMTTLDVYGCTNVIGDVNDLAQAMISAGRTSGTMNVLCIGAKITINGTPANEYVTSGDRVAVTFSGGTYSISKN